jgi:two-component system NarL family response regulator
MDHTQISMSGTSASPTIVLAIAPVLLRDGLHHLVSRAGFNVVTSTGDGALATTSALARGPDVVLVTVTLPPYGGLDVITSISHTRSNLAIVALIDTGSLTDYERALRAGAMSCVLLDDPFDHCLHVLQRATNGDAHANRPPQVNVVPESPFSAPMLSRREEQVLNLVSRGRTVTQIATDMVISPKTVKHHLSATYSKLGVHNRTDAVMTALRQGILRI